MARAGNWPAAEQLVESAPAPGLRDVLAPRLLRRLLAARRYRDADRCARAWGLSAAFPEAEHLCRQQCIQQHLRQGKFRFAEPVATTPALRRELFHGLLALGKYDLAADLRERLGLQDELPEVDPAPMAAER